MTDVEIIVQGAPQQPTGRRKLVLRRFLRNKTSVIALLILVALFVAAFVLPHFLPYTYTDQDKTAILQPPSGKHWFGTTNNGEDVLAQTLRGMQKSLIIGFGAAIISAVLATLAGALAGLLGGWVDRTVMWVVDLLLVVPSFIMIALFAPRTKGNDSTLLLMVLIGLFAWMISARIVRGLTMSMREREFVRAARYMGASTWSVIVTHIVPNIASILIIDTTLAIGSAVMAETGLSFLGFGVQWPDVSLGSLIGRYSAQAFTFPWTFMFASGVLVLIVLCANLVGDGLRDAFDPSAKRARSRKSLREKKAGKS
ncbi:ABC transporter permease [Nocardia huaxiensis]|uniref:Oligopeptide transport system permease protein OppC n=1 Tax=Nocardia huaxiensis TaxID=2755382 RepID=A0A7D6ZXP5_9NOCA|nr:ABC transporter permease [Nocardia huaxiensis]QLY31149.1 ABC transporter permease [Nocardia huaxiensis]UFS94680.1 ABC transporter permease [Nocardia huaxiensis]